MYDVIILGAGPAGMTAAVYSARQKMKTLVLTENIGGQTIWSLDIRNYMGYNLISGIELTEKFRKHVKEYNVELKDGEPALDLEIAREGFLVKTKKGTYETKSVIVCSGKKSKKLNVIGEDKYRGRGVTYCATCDGPLFAGKDVAIIGGGNSCLNAALQMIEIAKKVYIIDINSELGGETVAREKIKSSQKVEVINSAKVERINGGNFVSSISLRVSGKKRKIDLQGIIIEIGYTPSVEFAAILAKNQDSEIIINGKTETNVPGIFAAGDVSNVYGKQIIIAAGEGAKASLAAFKYVSTKKWAV
ncbi:MAG: FAD-dependent oxidoreductase [Candidatus Micrarchaeota archaeon]